MSNTHKLWSLEIKGNSDMDCEIMELLLGKMFGYYEDVAIGWRITTNNKWLCVLDRTQSKPDVPFWLVFIDLEIPIKHHEMEIKFARFPNTPTIMKLFSDQNSIPQELIWNCICGQPYVQYNIPVVWEDILSKD